MLFSRNRFNHNLYRYPTENDREKHQTRMDEHGFLPFREWEIQGQDGKLYYFCEYREISKA